MRQLYLVLDVKYITYIHFWCHNIFIKLYYIYVYRLHNDDNHSYDDVTQALLHALSCSSTISEELTAQVDTIGQANLGTVTSANIDRIYTLRNRANLLLSVAPSSIEEIEKRVPVILNWLQSIGK